uniref:Ubiquitin carboxyl-terminal hydrolase 7 n=1 Tax=Parastrongyloides trichosuri TaxID=131310 RepID=A0A0N4ZHR3_PARTI
MGDNAAKKKKFLETDKVAYGSMNKNFTTTVETGEHDGNVFPLLGPVPRKDPNAKTPEDNSNKEMETEASEKECEKTVSTPTVDDSKVVIKTLSHKEFERQRLKGLEANRKAVLVNPAITKSKDDKKKNKIVDNELLKLSPEDKKSIKKSLKLNDSSDKTPTVRKDENSKNDKPLDDLKCNEDLMEHDNLDSERMDDANEEIFSNGEENLASPDENQFEGEDEPFTPPYDENNFSNSPLDTPMRGNSDSDNFDDSYGPRTPDSDSNNNEEYQASSSETETLPDSVDDEEYERFCAENVIYISIKGLSEIATMQPDQQKLSEIVYIRGLPWRILLLPRDLRVNSGERQLCRRSLGFFLQCLGDNVCTAWSCLAMADLRIMSQIPGGTDYNRNVTHNFHAEANDWGFSQYITLDLLLDSKIGYCYNDTILMKCHVFAEVPHNIGWDSKRRTGFIGLKNQGTTCYMNSLLQAYFFIDEFRRSIYKIPLTDASNSETSVTLAMQRVFYELQKNDQAVSTEKLTKSFGWDPSDTLHQQDVQEFARVLLDNLELKMKNTSVADAIPNLFKGTLKSYVRCTNVDYESCRFETVYDVQLNIKNCRNIIECFENYVEAEPLDGPNKYDAGDHGFQDAVKGLIFLDLPKLLYLHLMRFRYEPQAETYMKVNDRCDYPAVLDLNKYVERQAGDNTNYKYHLHGVLVHSGDFSGGHYVAYINTGLFDGEQRWHQFNDETVSECCHREVFLGNFGGDASEKVGKPYSAAYMLAYIREDAIGEVLNPVTEEDVPKELKERFLVEEKEEEERRKDKVTSFLYQTFKIMLPKNLFKYTSLDLMNATSQEDFEEMKLQKNLSIHQFHEYVARVYEIPENRFRIWQLRLTKLKKDGVEAQLGSYRPMQLLGKYDEKCQPNTTDITALGDDNVVFLEFYKKRENGKIYYEELPPFSSTNELLFFIKVLHVDEETENVIVTVKSIMILSLTRSLQYYMKEFCKLCNTNDLNGIKIYEEISPDQIKLIKDKTVLIKDCLNLIDGGILILEASKYVFTTGTVPEWHEKVYNDCVVRCVPVSHMVYKTLNHTSFFTEEEQPEILLGLSMKCTLQQVAQELASQLFIDPTKVYFYNSDLLSMKTPQFSVPKTTYCSITLENLWKNCHNEPHDPRYNLRPYYLHFSLIPFNVNELLKTRVTLKIQVLIKKQKVEERIIFPKPSYTVSETLDEFKEEYRLGGSTDNLNLRMILVGCETRSNRVFHTYPPHTLIQTVVDKTKGSPLYIARIEEVVPDQLTVDEINEYLMPVSFFDKDPLKLYGVPFFFKITNNESYGVVRERIRNYLGISKKDFDKAKFTYVQNGKIVKVLNTSMTSTANLSELRQFNIGQNRILPFFLGIDLPNKSHQPKQSSEKSIVIRN